MSVRLKNGNYNEKFLLLLFLVLLSFQQSAQGGIFGAPQALYGPTDHVVVLNETNIKSTIYGTTNAWVVEFFSSWCGHCINFAPVYKQFATEVQGWKSVVKVGGIDCADENNIPICREYEIMGYPTILFFPPNSPLMSKKPGEEKPDFFRGEQFQRSDKVSQLKSETMELLTPYLPHILGDITTPINSFVGLWKYVKSIKRVVPPHPEDSQKPPSLLVLLFEKEKSLMGKELALLLSGSPEIRVFRFQQRNKLYERLGFKTEWPAAGYVTSDLRGGKFTIPKNKDIMTFLQNSALQMINAKSDFDAPPSNKPGEALGAQIAVALAEADVEKQAGEGEESSNLEEPMMRGASPNDDVVSMEDLIHAVRNSLRNEVGILKVVSGPKLVALKQYVHVLGQLFPADRREMIVFLMKLDKYLESQSELLQVNDYLDKLTELELELHPWDIDVNAWGSCRGTVPGRRGYTCGLWRLFHSLTILSTQRSQEIFVLPVIHGYVKEFFGCSECVQHFTKMVADEGPLMLSTVKGQALWLWRAHNKVNLRLKGSASEDPKFPKGPYPSETQCSSCHTEGESFDEDKVFEYLVNVYTHPTRTMQQVVRKRETGGWFVHSSNHGDQSKQRHHSSSSRFFSGTDYWIFCIVYLSVAALLIFGYYHFKLGSSRRNRLDPLAICRKLLHSSRSIV